MSDVAFEWFIPRLLTNKQRLIKAVMTSAAIVFLFDAIFFAAAMLFVALILIIVGFFLFRSWKIEYEYEYVNGDITISKVIRKAKRKEMYRTSRNEIEDILPGRKPMEGRAVRDFTSLRPNQPVYTLRVKGESILIEASEEFLFEMRKAYKI